MLSSQLRTGRKKSQIESAATWCNGLTLAALASTGFIEIQLVKKIFLLVFLDTFTVIPLFL
jgi:hypothetical protein